MLPRRPMSPNIQKSDLHQPKAKNQPQGQVNTRVCENKTVLVIKNNV